MSKVTEIINAVAVLRARATFHTRSFRHNNRTLTALAALEDQVMRVVIAGTGANAQTITAKIDTKIRARVPQELALKWNIDVSGVSSGFGTKTTKLIDLLHKAIVATPTTKPWVTLRYLGYIETTAYRAKIQNRTYTYRAAYSGDEFKYTEKVHRESCRVYTTSNVLLTQDKRAHALVVDFAETKCLMLYKPGNIIGLYQFDVDDGPVIRAFHPRHDAEVSQEKMLSACGLAAYLIGKDSK